ncbi:MAG TPA: hypothetical protein PK961_13170, partial [bacterium]|nr:hypothetical protein [bacterium]
MAHRIEVKFKDSLVDVLGAKVVKRIREDLNLEVENVRIIEAYTIDKRISPENLALIAEVPFSDPISQETSIGKPLAATMNWDWLVEVG